MVSTKLILVACSTRRKAEELRRYCFEKWGSQIKALNEVSPVKKVADGKYLFQLKLTWEYEDFTNDPFLQQQNFTGQCRITCIGKDENGRPQDDRTRDFPVHDPTKIRKRISKL